MADEKQDDELPHGTASRLDADDQLDVTHKGERIATIERGKGGRFRLRMALKNGVVVKRRKRVSRCESDS